MRKPIIAGNWKMNGALSSVDTLVKGILQGLATQPVTNCEVILFPAYLHLTSVVQMVTDSVIAVGSQDVDEREPGAVTGGVSAAMVRDAGCVYTLCGHSERRTLFGESDDRVAAKFAAALDAGLVPILCVGETLAEREDGLTIDVVARQLRVVMERVGSNRFSQGLLAYEPVWAIGTGESATPDQVDEVHAALRTCLRNVDKRDEVEKSNGDLAESMRILYGGSVSADNARELFARENVDGGLVGGAALKAESFLQICHAADTTVS